MCGIAGIVKGRSKKLNRVDALQGSMFAWIMSDRGRTSHGFSVINRHSSQVRYYKMGSEYIEPSKSVGNIDYVTELSNAVEEVKEGDLLFVHERAASSGAGGTNNRDNTQPLIVSFGDEYISLMHNGTIHNMEEIYEKEMGKPVEHGWSDSYQAAILFQNNKFEWLKNYNGAATFVWYQSSTKSTYFWRGESKLTSNSLSISEERPLYMYHDEGFTESLYFASTESSLLRIVIDSDEKNIKELESNTLYVCEESSSTLSKVECYSRIESQQNLIRAHKPHSISNNQSYYEPKPSKREFCGLLQRVAGSINYPYGYNYTTSNKFFSGLSDFRGDIGNDVTISLFKGLYYTNGQLSHSDMVFYSDSKKMRQSPEEYQTITFPFFINPSNGNVMSTNISGSNEEEYFWHGLMCDNKIAFNKLKNCTTAMSALEVSKLVKHPTHYGLGVTNEDKIVLLPQKVMYNNGVNINEGLDLARPYPYTSIYYKSTENVFVMNVLSLKLSNLLVDAANGEFNIVLFEELTEKAAEYYNKSAHPFNNAPVKNLVNRLMVTGFPKKNLVDFMEEIVL
tara:strand:+ start:11462 stop:13156 length:1695 start_codon:yes stop_codon:yes gene_type:complete